MSKYPVPIFQPTIPHDCQSNPAWLEQIHNWMSLQMERHEAFRRQLETQNHLLMQLNRRMDRVFLKLATTESESSALARPSAHQFGSAAHCSPEVATRGGLDASCNPNCASGAEQRGGEDPEALDFPRENSPRTAFGPENGPRSGVSSWMQQREVMLKCLVAQLEIEDSFYPAEIEPSESPVTSEVTPPAGNVSLTPPSDLQQNELVEIDALKEQLQAAIREMEVECSVQRAKLSHERARLEAREADLQRREKKLVRDSREQLIAEEKSEPLVSRIKGMLRRS